MDDPAKPISDSSVPPWHNPPPISETPVAPPSPVEPPPPPPPPPEPVVETPLVIQPAEPVSVIKPPKRKGAAKPIVLGLVFLLIAVSGVLGYNLVQKGGMSLLQQAREAECDSGETNKCAGGGVQVCEHGQWTLCPTATPVPPCQSGVKRACGTNGWQICDDGEWGTCLEPVPTTPPPTQPPPPPPTKPPPTQPPTSMTKCSDIGYGADEYCIAGGFKCRDDGNLCCKKPDGIPVCCFPGNAECFEGQQGSCLDKGNGTIWLKAEIIVSRIYEMTGTNVSCTNGFSSSQQNTFKTNYKVGNVVDGGETFSVTAGKCGQIDAVGYCGSCRAGCGQTTTSPTPIPSITPPTPVLGSCTNLEVYKAMVAPQMIANEPESPPVAWHVGDRLMIKVTFTEPVEDVAVRIIRNGAKVLDISREQQVPGSKSNPWVPSYAITEAGDYEIQAFVKVNGNWR